MHTLLACCLLIKRHQAPEQELFWLRASQRMCGPAVPVLVLDLYIVNCPSLRFGIYDRFDAYTVSMLPKDQAAPSPIVRAILVQRLPEQMWSCSASAGS
jgi:hypothetical protein